MFDRMLIPLDGSSLAEQALEPALLLGRGAGREVILFRAVSDVESLGETDAALERREAYRYLKSVQTAHPALDLKLTARIITGPAASAIVKTAAEEAVDLIVMSTHGYTGLSRLMYGSVAEGVLRAAPCPVLVIRSPLPLRRVLVPLDGSELAQQALAPGIEVAHRLGGEVTLLESVAREWVDEGQIRELDKMEPGLGDLLREGSDGVAESYLREMRRAARSAGVKVQTEVTNGPAAGRIIRHVLANNIDLVVMATHGRAGWQLLMRGSVTAKVLNSGCCSMLIIRPPEAELN
jgi:nucleotide-binding universal stress UspA family protein